MTRDHRPGSEIDHVHRNHRTSTSSRYVVALLGPLVLQSVAIGLHVVLGGQMPSLLALIGALPTVVLVSVYMLIFVALGEEVGWRGYALPALQARHGALLASVILGVVWAVWHLPPFFNPATLYSDLPFILFLAYLIPFTILITWVFNSSGGSVLVVMILHAVMNASSQMWKVLPEYSAGPGGMRGLEAGGAASVHVNLMGAIVLWVAAVAVVFVYGARNQSRRHRQVPADVGGEGTITAPGSPYSSAWRCLVGRGTMGTKEARE